MGIVNRSCRPVTLFVFLNVSILYVLFTHTQGSGHTTICPLRSGYFPWTRLLFALSLKKLVTPPKHVLLHSSYPL